MQASRKHIPHWLLSLLWFTAVGCLATDIRLAECGARQRAGVRQRLIVCFVVS
jgi:hypothetical protein